MDRYRTNCRMPMPYGRSNSRPSCGCGDGAELLDHINELPLAMGYVPVQTYKTTFEPCKGWNVGTIFPDLCKPFVGKRGKNC